ncbi:MAG: hypothetical protein IK038_02975 [Bacteroidaceae bacterium]|nr:hypothetical protein [Bacteroidaceae bacterium]
MVTDIDADDIKDEIDRLKDTQCEDISKEYDAIKDMVDRLKEDYEYRIDTLENENSDLNARVEELEDEIDEKKGYKLEDFASQMFENFTGNAPNAGEVISLAEDLTNLLTTKYNISIGTL